MSKVHDSEEEYKENFGAKLVQKALIFFTDILTKVNFKKANIDSVFFY